MLNPELSPELHEPPVAGVCTLPGNTVSAPMAFRGYYGAPFTNRSISRALSSEATSPAATFTAQVGAAGLHPRVGVAPETESRKA